MSAESTEIPSSSTNNTKSEEQGETTTASFQARRSNRVGVGSVSSDNDVWCEHLAVVERLVPGAKKTGGAENYELQIRSYFESTATGKKAWDEPPSGATQITYASNEAREMAKVQMNDLQITEPSTIAGLPSETNTADNEGMIDSVDEANHNVATSDKPLDKKMKDKYDAFKVGFKTKIGKFKDTMKKIDGDKVNPSLDETQGHGHRVISIKAGSRTEQIINESNNIDDDRELQRALEESLQTNSNNRHIVSDENGMTDEEQEALDMAVALSLSEAAATHDSKNQDVVAEEDDAELNAVIEQSKLDGVVASNDGPSSSKSKDEYSNFTIE
jgi:hypothetical protein